MIGIAMQARWGRAFAGLALLLCAAGCSDEAGSGPAPATQDEKAALEDAAAMLEEREPMEPVDSVAAENAAERP
ncbi:MAG: hypothetical protein WA957_06685 [Alteraurantiacibacter sp.]